MSAALESVRARLIEHRSRSRKYSPIPGELRSEILRLIDLGLPASIITRECGVQSTQIAAWRRSGLQAQRLHRESIQVLDVIDGGERRGYLRVGFGRFAIDVGFTV